MDTFKRHGEIRTPALNIIQLNEAIEEGFICNKGINTVKNLIRLLGITMDINDELIIEIRELREILDIPPTHH